MSHADFIKPQNDIYTYERINEHKVSATEIHPGKLLAIEDWFGFRHKKHSTNLIL